MRGLTSRVVQDAKLRFECAVVAEESGAVEAYLDWLADTGFAAIHRKLLKAYTDDKQVGTPHSRVYALVFSAQARQLEKLVPKVTAFTNWNQGGWFWDGPNWVHDGMWYAMRHRGYVPTLRRSSSPQERLGAILEAWEYQVFWVA